MYCSVYDGQLHMWNMCQVGKSNIADDAIVVVIDTCQICAIVRF